MRALASLSLALGCLLLGAVPCSAADVSVGVVDQSASPSKGPDYVAVLAVVDRQGASDVLEVRREGRTFVVAGTPAPTPGEGCVTAAAGEVRCTPPGAAMSSDGGSIDLGAGDDHLGLSSVGRVQAEGGAGADTLVVAGPPSTTTWDGGPGADVVRGVATVVDYAQRTAAVSVTFDGRADDGEPGEGDDVGAAGSAVGGAGDDVLVAAPSGSTLTGGPGDDVLVGGPGDDVLGGGGRSAPPRGTTDADQLSGMDGDDALLGGEGSDRLDGGAGDDRLEPGDQDSAASDRDRSTGGPGRDSFAHIDFLLAAPLDLVLGAPGPVQDVEVVRIGRPRVHLTGSDAPEEIELQAFSRSTLDGGGGDDVLSTSRESPRRSRTIVGGAGRDDVRPGSPGDVLELRDGDRDAVACGPGGLLTTPRLDRADRLAGCGAPMRMDPATATLRGRVLTVPVTCPRATPERCRGTLGLDSGGAPAERFRVRATRPLDLPRGAVTPVQVRLGARQVARLVVAQRRLARTELAVRFRVGLRRDLRGQSTPVRSEWSFALRVARP